MGRSNQAKIDKQAAHERSILLRLGDSGPRMRVRKQEECARVDGAIDALLEPHLPKAWRALDTFKSKTRSRSADKRALEMARHLFGRHPVPPILWQAWQCPAARVHAGVDPRSWFVAVGLGQSFLKTCAKGILTRKEAHLFLACPHGLGIDQALRWAVCRAAGASDGLALRVCKSKISTLPFDEFWRQGARFFAEQAPASPQEASDLCDYLLWRRGQEAEFNVFGHGFTIASLRGRMHDWHRDLARSKALGDARWAGASLPDWKGHVDDPDGARMHWSATQVLDSKSLAAEGNAMRHCVLSYKARCADGSCSIWSIRRGYDADPADQDRRLTIELNSEGRMVQARGLANRTPRPDEAKALRLWSRQIGVDIDSAAERW